MLCCLPFLSKAEKVKVKAKAKAIVVNVKAEEAKDDYPKEETPQLSLKTPNRIPDALMEIRNPAIKAQLKEFCKKNNLCVGCSYANPENPMVLVFNGVLYECPHCDSDVESP